MTRISNLISWTNRHGLINLIHRLSHKRIFETPVSEKFRVGNSSILDSHLFAKYPSLCGLAAENDEFFDKFRSTKVIADALDHVSIEQGKDYIDEILMTRTWTKEFTIYLKHIDSVGHPRKFKFSPHGTFSPTLLRYLKVYIDLIDYFGSLQMLNIVEIGVGFGGQSSLIGLLDTPKSYTLYDIPPVLDLTRKFMKKLEIPGKFFFADGRNPNPAEPDLVLSNYAFSELTRDVQSQYLERVILGSPRGYITWNSLSHDKLGGHSLAELIRIIPNSQIEPEKPNTMVGNAIIVWGF